jgi:hypothetical protein
MVIIFEDLIEETFKKLFSPKIPIHINTKKYKETFELLSEHIQENSVLISLS